MKKLPLVYWSFVLSFVLSACLGLCVLWISRLESRLSLVESEAAIQSEKVNAVAQVSAEAFREMAAFMRRK